VTTLTDSKASMELLASEISAAAGRPVVDQTGLKGNYDFTLKWGDDDPDAPSIFTAIEEQLGLKLEPAKAAIDFLVIDRAEKPDEN
jgi:bla regulator protein BlaR1